MDEVNCSANIKDLPQEILEYIFSLLSPYKDFKSVMLVCRDWHIIMLGVVNQEFFLFRHAMNTASLLWEQSAKTTSIVTERYSHSSCYFDRSMFVFGGCTATGTTFNDLWQFDLATRQWIRPLAVGTYPTPKACASLVAYKDTLILFGGWSHPTPYPLHQAARFFNQLHIYCPLVSRWSQVMPSNSPPGKAGHGSSIIGDAMIVFGGSYQLISCNEVWALDLLYMNWTLKDIQGVKPYARYGHSQLVLDDKHILILGGCGGSNMQFNDAWMLSMETDVWSWSQLHINNPENGAPQLWCHPACKVGDKVVVLSKTNRPQTEPVCKHTPPPRQPHNNHGQPEGRGQLLGQRDCAIRRTASPDNGPSQAGSAQICHCSNAPVATQSNNVPMAKPSGGVYAAPFSNTVPVAASSSSVGAPAPHRMPSIRPNAMRNRKKLLEVLQRYEDRIKAQRRDSVLQRGLVNEPVAAIFNLMAPAASVQNTMPINPMYMHVLDISEAVSKQTVTWLPLHTNYDENAPEETIFYSLIEGRGELIMFGGIQTDLGGMQRGLDVKQQTVSNSVHFLRTEHVLR